MAFFPRRNDDGETSKILGSDVIPNSMTPRFRDDSKIPRRLPKVEIRGRTHKAVLSQGGGGGGWAVTGIITVRLRAHFLGIF